MNDDLLNAIDEANTGRAPPPFGELEFVLPGSPASVQSSRDIKAAYLERIRALFSAYDYVLTGQIMLDVEWIVPAKSRYETDARADIDNCIKPIIDAFTGPNGLFINDCQLKGLYICWRTIESDNERLNFKFRFESDQFSERAGLAFLDLGRGLCCHVNTNWSVSMRLLWVFWMRKGGLVKNSLEKLRAPYIALAGIQGGVQPFHRTRTGGFPVLTEDQFIKGVEALGYVRPSTRTNPEAPSST